MVEVPVCFSMVGFVEGVLVVLLLLLGLVEELLWPLLLLLV